MKLNFLSRIKGYRSTLTIIALLLILTTTTQAQNAQQQIQLSGKNLTVRAILDEIQKQSPLHFVYSKTFAAVDKVVTFRNTSENIETIFAQISAKTGLSFTYSGSQVIVREKQVGSISGTVKTSDGKPAEFVTVSIKDVASTPVAQDGHYQLRNIPEGEYSLSASFVGLGTQARQITVEAGHVTNTDFILSQSGQQLNEVVVSTNKNTNPFATAKTEDMAKMPLKDLENPQVTNVVSSELIKVEMLTNFKDAIKNATGIVSLGQDGAYSVRGFVTSPNLRNGVAAYNTTDIDLANVEKIEVLKGPSGTLFGSPLVSWGGLINKVTKQPYDHTGGEINYTQGSFGLSRITGDFNTPLNKDTTVMLRMNAAHTSQSSYMDFGFNKSTFFAPVMLYRPNTRFSISIEGEFNQTDGTAPAFIFFPTQQNYQLYLNNYKRSFNNNDMVLHTGVANIYGEVKYKLSDHWTSQTLITYTRSDGPTGTYVPRYFQGADSVSRSVDDYKTNTTTTNEIQQNFISDYKWGKMRNRIVTGIDFYSYNYNYEDYYMDFDVVSLSNPGTDYLNLSKANVFAREQSGDPSVGHYIGQSKNYVYAAYVSDVFNITDNLLINAALRVDRFDNKGDYDLVAATWSGNYKQTSLSPKFGIVYQPVKDMISLFGNYSNGFQNNTGVAFGGKVFKPSNGSQVEGGIKLDAWQHKISATVSYYRIHAADLLSPDPAHTNYSIQNGIQTSKGIEATLIAAPLTGLNIVAGYSYNDKTVESGDNSYAPKNQANLYINYKLTSGKTTGLGASFGGNYAGTSPTLQHYGFNLPGYTILNASVFYDQPHYRLGIRSDNLTNKKYFLSYFDLEPQMLRSISATLAVKF